MTAGVYDKTMQPALTKQRVQLAAWGLAAIVCGLAFLAWGEGLNWRLSRFSAYKLFPLFGLLAFSLMWSHYMAGVVRRQAGMTKESIQSFLQVTGWLVLVLICLHPGLLVWQLWRDGFGLPPGSYLQNYVAPKLAWVALLGTVSLGVFLSYETKRWFARKAWWPWVAYASDVAMLAVFYHGLRLGRNLHEGWYRQLWWLYGALLVAALIYIHWYDYSVKSQKSSVKLKG